MTVTLLWFPAKCKTFLRLVKLNVFFLYFHPFAWYSRSLLTVCESGCTVCVQFDLNSFACIVAHLFFVWVVMSVTLGLAMFKTRFDCTRRVVRVYGIAHEVWSVA